MADDYELLNLGGLTSLITNINVSSFSVHKGEKFNSATADLETGVLATDAAAAV